MDNTNEVKQGWFLNRVAINGLQDETITATLAHAKKAHSIDIVIRKDGKEMRYQADWVKHLVPRLKGYRQ